MWHSVWSAVSDSAQVTRAKIDATLRMLRDDKLPSRVESNWLRLTDSRATVSALLLGTAAGSVSFNSCMFGNMLLARALNVSCNQRVRSTLIGALGLSVACTVASYSFLYASCYTARQLGVHRFPFQPSSVRAHDEDSWFQRNMLGWLRYSQSQTDSYISDEHLFCIVSGMFLFALAGGRLRYLSPSDLRLPGPFASRKHALPAKLYEYATPWERKQIQLLGKKFGCHHCGSRAQTAPFTADHIPPNKYHTFKWQNARWLWRVQRFYPQCSSCSAKQAVSVRSDSAQLIFPRRLRLFNLWLPLPHIALALFSTGVH